MNNFNKSYNCIGLATATAIVMVMGTNVPNKYSTYEPRLSSYISKEKSLVDSNFSIAENIKFIRNTFNLNVSELADLLNVSRPTVYSWMKGETTKNGDYQKHINFVREYAGKIANLKLERPDSFMKRPLSIEGQIIYIFDSLKNQIDISNIAFEIIKKMDNDEKNIRNIPSKLKNIQSDRDLFSNKYV